MAPRRKAGPKDRAGTTPANATDAPDAADAVDQQLERYRSMRDFGVTAEPSGKSRSKIPKEFPAGSNPFVIQKHAATRLHYDFRLGWNGVLKSWAVAKGPSYYVGDKRLAVQVEDHPMEYGGFEGIIPKGQYGGGTVMVWDQGTWEPQPGHTDVDAGLRDGSLKFILYGTKLKGKWALIRMKPRPGDRNPNWLLIKEHDEYERAESDPAITDEAPNSAVTGRSIEEIASAETHVWNSKDTATGKAWYRKDQPRSDKASATPAKAARKKAAKKIIFGSTLDRAPKEDLPDFITPQLAAQAIEAPRSSGWVHELKLDGYRIQARKDGDRIQLLTRTGLDWTHRMKALALLFAALPADTAILDGEVVVVSPSGTTSFASLQAAFQEGAKHPLTYFAFDLLHLNGHNLRDLSLIERKALLSRLLENADDAIRYSEHVDAPGDLVFKEACKLHAEGIISKRADGKYISSRTTDWRKLKCIHEQEFVIGGFTLPSNEIYGVGALLLGYYQNGKLIYAGRTGTGFTQKTHAMLRARLDKLRRASPPFESVPPDARRGAIWVKPELVAQVNFATWTADNLVRQAAFQGLREDKPAAEVRREDASTPPSAGKSKPASKHAAHSAPVSAAAKTVPAKKSAKPSTSAAPASHAPVRLTHPDKVLDAESHLTKQQLADYYWAVAPHMLPHIAGRPLSLVRCPEGTAHPCFFQKHVNNTLPPGIDSVSVLDRKTGKVEPYITLCTPEALAGLAQLGVLEVHPWGSRNDDLEHPDRIVIDLDPDPALDWPTLAASAAEVRKQFKNLGLESFLKTTGGKGLHVVVPIQPQYEWPVIKGFTHAFVLDMEKRNPSLYLTKMTKSARAGRIFLDYLRNQREATAVAAYSPRARAGAPVSLPLPWTDLKLPDHPVFRVVDFDEWKPRLRRDPWRALPETKQRITAETLRFFKIPETK